MPSSCRVLVASLCLPLLIVVAANAGAQTAGSSAGTATMKPGLWETSQLIETTGINSRRTVTSRSCFSADDVKSTARIVPQQHEAPMKCENRDIKAQGGKIDWRIVCTGERGAASNGSGEMTVAADSFKADAKLDSKAGGKTAKVHQTISGKWISASCR